MTVCHRAAVLERFVKNFNDHVCDGRFINEVVYRHAFLRSIRDGFVKD
jgi:hypothetical protein